MGDNARHLVSLADRPIEERKAIQSKGGRTRVQRLNERKALKEAFEVALEITERKGKATPLENLRALDAQTLEKANLTAQSRMVLSMVLSAINGDTKAFELIRDQIGEKPTSTEDIKSNALECLAQALKGETKQEAEDHIDEVPT